VGPDDDSSQNSGSATATAPAPAADGTPYYVANPNAGADPSPAPAAAPSDAAPTSVGDTPLGGILANAPQPQTTPATVSDTIAKNKNFFQKTYDGVMAALGGAQQVSFTMDNNTGTITKHDSPATPGTQWKRIIAGALSGLAASGGAGLGPGQKMRGLSLGIQGGQQAADRQQAQQDKAKQELGEDYDRQHRVALESAQIAHFNQQLTANNWQLAHSKIVASQELTDYVNKFSQFINEAGDNASYVGHFGNAQDAMKAVAANPDLPMQQTGMHPSGQLISRTSVNDKGEVDGGEYYLVKPDWLDAKNENPVSLPHIEVGSDGKKTVVDQILPPNSISNRLLLPHYLKGNEELTKDQLEQQKVDIEQQKADDEAKKTPSVIAENYARAGEARGNTVGAGGDGSDDATTRDAAEGLATGRYIMGKDFPTRTPKGQETAAQYARAANAYSMQTFGLPYNPETIRQEARLAEAPKTQAFLSGIDRMIGSPGMPGQLDQVLDLARRAKLGDTAPVNQLKLWVQTHMGKEDAKNFETILSDTQTALGSLIGNPLLGSGESDLKMKTAQAQFGSNPTLGNLTGAVATTKQVLESSRAALAKNNRYIQQRYGSDYSPKAAPAAQLPQAALDQITKAGGQPVTFGNGQVWQAQNGQPVRVK
jgi:hypothetical protein